MKKIFLALLVMTFMVTIVDDASAQRRKKRKTREDKTEDTRKSRGEEDFNTVSFADKLNPEIKLGNLNFFGNQFSLSTKLNLGYKFNNTFSAGVGGKMFYDYINQLGNNDFSVFSYGGLAYGRVKVTKEFYLQGEYSIMNFGSFSTFQEQTLGFPTAGIGYMQNGYNWAYGFELMVILDDEVRDTPQLNFVEYWINFSHNF